MAVDGVLRVCLIGQGIRKSLSPALHEAEAAALGLRYSYELVDLDDAPDGPEALEGVLDRIQSAGFAGCNITFPVKQSVIPLLTSLSPEAEAMRAVNTIKFASDGRRVGHNTDWWGFGENLARTLPGRAMSHVVLLGAGGAGAAAAYALAQQGAGRLSVVDSDVRRAVALAKLVGGEGMSAEARSLDELEGLMAEADGLVHATPTGMVKHPGIPVPASFLRPSLWVAEIVYVPLETELLRTACAIGCATADGGGMVVLQAARAFEIFSGRKADPDRMLRHFRMLIA
jgi:shikimate dehydrogenase